LGNTPRSCLKKIKRQQQPKTLPNFLFLYYEYLKTLIIRSSKLNVIYKELCPVANIKIWNMPAKIIEWYSNTRQNLAHSLFL
jgi:hypothetical protein